MTAITVVGTGYTGRRILDREPGACGVSRSVPKGIDRSRIQVADLDGDATDIDAPGTVIYTVPPPESGHDTRIDTLLSAFDKPPQRFVYLSTTGVYGDRQGAIVRESDATSPKSERAKRRVAAERQLRDWSEQQGVDLVVLRVPGIYGPGRLMLERVRERAPMIADAEAGPGNRIHVDDLVSCCLAAVTAPPGIYNLGDGDTRSSTWFVREIARQLGVEAGPEISREEAERTFSERRLSFLSESRTVDTKKMRKVLGVVPKYANAEKGIRASLSAE